MQSTVASRNHPTTVFNLISTPTNHSWLLQVLQARLHCPNPEEVRHASRNADSVCPFLPSRQYKKGHAESAFRDARRTSSGPNQCKMSHAWNLITSLTLLDIVQGNFSKSGFKIWHVHCEGFQRQRLDQFVEQELIAGLDQQLLGSMVRHIHWLILSLT